MVLVLNMCSLRLIMLLLPVTDSIKADMYKLTLYSNVSSFHIYLFFKCISCCSNYSFVFLFVSFVYFSHIVMLGGVTHVHRGIAYTLDICSYLR